MHFSARSLWKSLRTRSTSRRARRPVTARPRVETLEDRAVPAALGSITATAYIDVNHDGRFDAGDTPLSAVPVTLTGPITTTATTGANGAATFGELTPGTYQVQFNVTGYNGSGLVSNIDVGAGQNVNVSVPYTGIANSFLNETLFLNDTGANPFRFIAPTITKSIGDQLGTIGQAQDIDLAGFFNSPALTTSQLSYNIGDNGQILPLNVTLFDGQTPQTVDNFYDYVNSGRFNNGVFTRLVPGFVLQGGGLEFSGSNPNGKLTNTPIFTNGAGTQLTVPNEFAVSNTAGTIAMGQSNGINSATEEFFFNLVDNTANHPNNGASGNLDAESFTVFGKVTGASDLNTLTNTLANTPNFDESSSGAPAGVVENNFPLNNFTLGANSPAFPSQTTADNYLQFKNFTVNRPYSLTFSVVSNSNPSVVTATMVNEQLVLTGVSAGTSTITVKATDPFGKSAQQSFNVTIA